MDSASESSESSNSGTSSPGLIGSGDDIPPMMFGGMPPPMPPLPQMPPNMTDMPPASDYVKDMSIPAQVAAPMANQSSSWSEHKTPEGIPFYHNSDPKPSTWEKPADLITPSESSPPVCVRKPYTTDAGRVSYHEEVLDKRTKWMVPHELPEIKDKIAATKPAQASLSTDMLPVEVPLSLSPSSQTGSSVSDEANAKRLVDVYSSVIDVDVDPSLLDSIPMPEESTPEEMPSPPQGNNNENSEHQPKHYKDKMKSKRKKALKSVKYTSVPLPMDELPDFNASKLEVCRVCLTTDVKMYSLQNLATSMESISGHIKFYVGLPQYVCYECAPILLKWNKLIEKYKRAQATLLYIITKNGQINKTLIKEQNKAQLQSTLDSYIKLNYYHINYDVKNTLTLIELNQNENGSLDGRKSETDVQIVEADVPVIEIISDDEEIHDDLITSKSRRSVNLKNSFKRDKAKEKTLDFKASSLEVCRICLTVDIQMYSLQGTNLGTFMETISDVINSYDGLPNYICYQCAPVLLKCKKLTEKIKTAQATLLGIFNKNGQINKSLIKRARRSRILISSLECYLVKNYSYIMYDDINKTSDFVKIYLNNNKVTNEIIDESSIDTVDSEILENAAAEEADTPMIEIISDDDEKIDDDCTSLESYDVERDERVNAILAKDYHKSMLKLKSGEKGKKRKIIKTGRTKSLCPVHFDEHLLRFFNVSVIPTKRVKGIIVAYSCKLCLETFENVKNAELHINICQKGHTQDK